MSNPTNEQYIELYNLLFDANVDVKDYEGMEEEIEDDMMEIDEVYE